MDVLRAVNNEIDNYPMIRAQLKPYAGPQCFAQLQDEERSGQISPGKIRVWRGRLMRPTTASTS